MSQPITATLHLTFPYVLYDITALSMTTPLATSTACSQRLHPRKYAIPFTSMTNTTDGIHLTHLFLLDGATVPFPFSLPLISLTYITRQQTNITASRTATRPRDARSAALLFWERPSQKYIRWAFPYPPSLSTNLILRGPKPTYGQLTLRGPLGGLLFAPPILGPWASDP